MNIFALSYNPRLAAQYACDRHIVKMILEGIEALCIAHRVLDGRETSAQDGLGRKYRTYRHRDRWWEAHLPYAAPKPQMYKNHHMLWAMESLSNYVWLTQHVIALAEEYYYRWGYRKDRQHKWHKLAVWLATVPPANIPDGALTPFRQGVVEDCKRPAHRAVWAHRLNYVRYKSRFAVWTRRRPPAWYLDMQERHPPRHNGQRRSVSPRLARKTT